MEEDLLNIPEEKESKAPQELLIDQVIGQPRAVEAIYRAAKSRRNLLLIGLPGTGKSMLGKALAEILPPRELQDVIASPNRRDPMRPLIKTIPAGTGQQLVENEVRSVQRQKLYYNLMTLLGIVALFALGGTFYILGQDIGFIEVLFALLITITWVMYRQSNSISLLENTSSLIISQEPGTVPFVDASGSAHNILLGDVRHDPYQSGGLETPPHHLIIPGLIHKAHGGVLFIDEIGTLDPISQFHLLTVMQDKKMPIEGRSEGSSGSVVKTEPVPCDFTLVAAGNYETVEQLHPALRDRIQGYGMEVLMERHLPIESEKEMVHIFHQLISQEIDTNQIEFTDGAVQYLVYLAETLGRNDGHISLQFRSIGGIIRSARDIAAYREATSISVEDVMDAFDRQSAVEAQQRQELVEQSIQQASENWDNTRIWMQYYDNNFFYQVLQLIHDTNNTSESTVKLLTLLEEQTGISGLQEKLKPFRIYGLKWQDNELPAALLLLLLSFHAGKQLSSKLVITGTFDGNLEPNVVNDISSRIHDAVTNGFEHIVVISRIDHRKIKPSDIEKKVTIISSLDELCKFIVEG
jgi:Lon-like ATP-dependent protease